MSPLRSRLRRAALLALALPALAAAGPRAETFLDFDGVRLRYLARGRGEPVVLLHGYASGIDHGWRRRGVVRGLAEAGFRVIALDQRGHGASDKPHAARYGREMGEDVLRLLDHLEIDRAHLVGYSMGAIIAHQLRHRYPDRLLSVTLAGYGETPWEIPSEVSEEFVDTVARNLLTYGLAAGNDPRALAWLAVQWPEWALCDSELEDNAVPVLALIGADDEFLPDTRALAETMPGVELRVVPGSHADAPSRPQFLAALLEFLRANGAPAPAPSPARPG